MVHNLFYRAQTESMQTVLVAYDCSAALPLNPSVIPIFNQEPQVALFIGHAYPDLPPFWNPHRCLHRIVKKVARHDTDFYILHAH